MEMHEECTVRCQMSEHKGYQPCPGECQYLLDKRPGKIVRTALNPAAAWPFPLPAKKKKA